MNRILIALLAILMLAYGADQVSRDLSRIAEALEALAKPIPVLTCPQSTQPIPKPGERNA